MANLNNKITVSSAIGVVTVNETSFGTVLIVSDGATGFAGEVREYANAAEIAADETATDITAALSAFAQSVFGQDRAPTIVKIADIDYTGFASSDLDAVEVIDDDWYGLIMHGTGANVEANILVAAAWTQTKRKMYFAQTSDAAVIAGTAGNVAEDLQGFGYFRTACFYHDDNTEPVALCDLSQFLAVDPDNATTIAAWKAIAGATPQTQLTTGEINTVLGLNANLYQTVNGVNGIFDGTMADGTYIDQVLTMDWCDARVEEETTRAIASIVQAGGKVPFTNAGIALLEGVIRKILERGEREEVGHFQPGSSFVTGKVITDVTAANRQQRKLVLDFGASFADAIQEAAYTQTLVVE